MDGNKYEVTSNTMSGKRYIEKIKSGASFKNYLNEKNALTLPVRRYYSHLLRRGGGLS